MYILDLTLFVGIITMQFYKHYTLVNSKSIGQEILNRIQARGGCLVKRNWTAKSKILFITAF